MAISDDELPDYVMVMIANKKSKDQMKADLELFLGEYCGGFCDWLHQVLDHLQRYYKADPTVNANVL